MSLATRTHLLTLGVAATAAGLLALGGTVGASRAPAPAAGASGTTFRAASVAMQEVMSEYVYATDHRDGTTLAALFTPAGVVNIMDPDNNGGYTLVTAPIVGRAAIANAVAHAQAPIPAYGAEHHVITAPIATATRIAGHLTMQYTTYAIQGPAKPAAGWPAGTAGTQGTIKPYETGYYDASFVLIKGAWYIARLNVDSDLPVVIPSS